MCSPETNAAAAAELMWKRNCGSLPVVDGGGRVVGMITDRDLLIALGTSNRRASEVIVGEVMHEKPSVCVTTDTVGAALKAMAERQVRRLPVVDAGGWLKGILSMNDVAQHAGSDGDLSYEDAGRTLKSIGEARAVKSAPKVIKADSAKALKTKAAKKRAAAGGSTAGQPGKRFRSRQKQQLDDARRSLEMGRAKA